MSITAIKHVIEHSKTKGSARVLMIVLADMANDDGECWPGKANLGQKVNCHPRHVVRLVQECERLGELRVIESTKEGESNRYLITALAPKTRIGRARDLKETRKRKFPVTHDTGVTDDTSVIPLVTSVSSPPMTPVSPKPKVEPTKKPKNAGAKAPRPRNAHFDAIVEAFQYNAKLLTTSEKTLIGKAAAELKAAEYTPDEIPLIHAYCVKKGYEGFTAAALAKHAGAWRATQKTGSASGLSIFKNAEAS